VSAKSIIDDIAAGLVAAAAHERSEANEEWIVTQILCNPEAPTLARAAIVIRHALANLQKSLRGSAR
jgi:hypothetical protein